jgi:hypothetical protein
MPQAVREVAPGIFHWSASHEGIGIDVHSHFLAGPRVLLDPMVPPDGIEWFDSRPPVAILLTNRHHWRQGAEFVERFGCPVRASRPGMHEFSAGEPVEPFDFGDELEGGLVAHEVGALCPDETALYAPAQRALAVADGVVRLRRRGHGPPGFVPDDLMGDDPEVVKAGLLAAYRGLLDLDFEHLLLAHGHPLIGDGKAALARFVGSHVG